MREKAVISASRRVQFSGRVARPPQRAQSGDTRLAISCAQSCALRLVEKGVAQPFRGRGDTSTLERAFRWRRRQPPQAADAPRCLARHVRVAPCQGKWRVIRKVRA